MFSHYVNILSGNDKSEEEASSNPIELIFKNGIENATIEQVLGEQECITACKWGNEKLEKL